MSREHVQFASEVAEKIVKGLKASPGSTSQIIHINSTMLQAVITHDLAKALDAREGEKSPPSRPTCAMCGQPIVKNGNFWEHVDSNPRHPARPAKIPGQKETHL